jgi:hypothetical protein
MTVDEMILQLSYDPLENHGGVWMTKEQGEQIIAALRAGQELSTLVLQGAVIGARGERDLFAAAYKFKNAAVGENK